LCQGQIAPQFVGVDLGLAEKLAVRAVATIGACGARIHDHGGGLLLLAAGRGCQAAI
jgi:Na+/serine symporter